MYKIEGPQKLTLGITPFKWGIYHHFRFRQRWFHFKWGFWIQDGIRVSTRKQLKEGKKARYVKCMRFQISIWSTRGSKQGKPRVFGCMFYGGGGNGR